MNGVDVIAFAGGVGERGIDERKEICSYLGFMGVELDEEPDEDENIIVNVPDTKLYKGIMIALSGFVITGLSITLTMLNKRDKKGNRQ